MKKGDKIGPDERFQVVDLLGGGTYGEVWKAFDSKMRREVAIKIMHEKGDAVKKLVNEAVLGGLSHKNIVQIYEQFPEEGFIVMECVSGKSLEKLLKEHILNGTWPDEGKVTEIVEQLLEALQYAHDNKRIHGDIKPGNILIPERGEVRISDFGVAVALSPASGQPIGSSISKDWKGSASYAAPEVQEIGPRGSSVQSDLFSAGVVIYLLLTKKHPFLHPSGLFNIPDLIKRREFQIVAPKEVVQEVSEQLESMVLKLLKYSPEERFRSATEVLQLVRPKPTFVPCPECTYENNPEAIFCSKCGEKLVLEIKPTIPEQLITRQAHETFFIKQQPEEAEKLLRENISKFRKKGMAEALSLLAFILNNTRKYEEARQFGNEAQQMNPNLVEPYRVISFAESQLGNYSEAVSQLDKALDKADTPYIKADIIYQRGRTHQMQGDYDIACRDAKQALALNPMHLKARRLRDTVCI